MVKEEESLKPLINLLIFQKTKQNKTIHFLLSLICSSFFLSTFYSAKTFNFQKRVKIFCAICFGFGAKKNLQFVDIQSLNTINF